MNKNTAIIAIIVAAIICGAAGFYGGMQYQASKSPALALRNGTFAGRGGGRFGGAGAANAGGRVAGQVLGVSGNTLTVKLPDGSSKIVVLSSSTTYNKATQGSQTDLSQGENVNVFGTTNSDGSVTAQSVSIVPAGMNMFGGRRPQASASSAAQ